ncbi:MAG TPA: TMEM165/GDT1 family protein [Acidimicrobiia bacterium]|jgi:putative Ca2+/H+ antiporter (TMEM165/GDT1 family)|nr:TMEM165/GDT1 family protein [Acidimicrobiia bacterium]
MDLGIAVAVFPIIFIGELPDKTMFASLVLASRGRPRLVWVGAAAAFLVHVAIATTIGAGLFAVVSHRVLDWIVTALFVGGAVYAFLEGARDETSLVAREAASHRQIVVTAFLVIFLAEWGDLTQILTANLAAHYHSPLSVGVGALAALWCVAALAVASGQTLLRFFPVTTVRRITGVVLLVLAGVAAWSAVG